MSTLSIFAPAKLNLFLAITGRREDGFHDLVSVVVTVDFGDTLRIEGRDAGGFELACDDPTVPVGENNLVLKAARAFAAATGWRGGAKFSLEKRVPMGAGLGGGSSDAVAALRGLNELAGGLLAADRMAEIAATLGSDCPLFLKGAPVVMRGRGERVEVLPTRAAGRLVGRRVLIFKPGFGISTPWAYRQMVARAKRVGKLPPKAQDGSAGAVGSFGIYLPLTEAETRLAAWEANGQAAEGLLFNNMERVAFAKFIALPVLLERLRRQFGVVGRMSGSGSACFALLEENAPVAALKKAIGEDWGASAFVTEARIM